MSAGRLRVLLAVVLLLVALVDFTRRIHVPRDVQPRDADSFMPVDLAPPVTAAAVASDLATWLPGLAPVVAGAGPAADTEWALTLLAVFVERGSPFAVVRATPAAGGAARVQRIAEGDAVFGYRVARIEPQRVQLEGPDGPQDLLIFEPAQPVVWGSGAPPAAGSGAIASPGVPDAAAAAGSPAGAAGPARTQAAPGPAPAAAGPKQVQAAELQPGQAFELPASMRGLKVVDAPVPPPKSDPGREAARPQPAPPPQKP